MTKVANAKNANRQNLQMAKIAMDKNGKCPK